MKRTDLIRRIRTAAKANGIDFDQIREGAEHTIYRYGAQQIVVPRHREINEHTARAILRDLGLR